jgi:ABC-2 type transport system ATP-binding protein
VLELIGLRRSFDDVVALDDVSFAVPEGAIVGFVGPNGAGKTTAMRIALGVLEPDAGEVRWRGEPVDALARRRFGYMPEERGLYPKMRVREQLVEERAGDRVESLSLGNQQRVQLAAALVHEPDALVLDEPFSGLDPVGVDVLAGVLRRQAQNHGVPVVFSSHQLDLVERICDAVVLIDHGRVVASGTIDELRASRARRLLRVEVVGAADGWYDALPGVTLESEADGAVVLLLDDDVDEQRVLDLARASGDVLHFTRVRPSLAELFREVVSA